MNTSKFLLTTAIVIATTMLFCGIARLADAEPTDPFSHPAQLDMADMTHRDLRGADLRNAYAPASDFIGSDLRGADFTNADLRWADFTDADLRGATFYRASLSWANFEGAQMEGVDLSSTLIRSVRISGTIVEP